MDEIYGEQFEIHGEQLDFNSTNTMNADCYKHYEYYLY